MLHNSLFQCIYVLPCFYRLCADGVLALVTGLFKISVLCQYAYAIRHFPTCEHCKYVFTVERIAPNINTVGNNTSPPRFQTC